MLCLQVERMQGRDPGSRHVHQEGRAPSMRLLSHQRWGSIADLRACCPLWDSANLLLQQNPSISHSGNHPPMEELPTMRATAGFEGRAQGPDEPCLGGCPPSHTDLMSLALGVQGGSRGPSRPSRLLFPCQVVLQIKR